VAIFIINVTKMKNRASIIENNHRKFKLVITESQFHMIALNIINEAFNNSKKIHLLKIKSHTS